MNSRLNLSLREKHGFVYSIGSSFTPFTDTGLFVITFGTEPSQLIKSVKLVKEELRKLREEKMGVKQLSSAKEQIMGQVAMAEESNISFMMMMARSILDLGKIQSLEEIFSRIQSTTAEDIMKMSNEMFDEKKLSYLMMEPEKLI
jgi:predicted Zn-dependent peptidase